MNLVGRYVEAVKRYLPVATREDTGKELSGLIEDGLEALREEKGRELTEEEVSQFLRNYGHPYKVAAAYRRRRALVSENAYPLYKRTLVFTLSVYLLVNVVLTLFQISQEQTWAIGVIPKFLHSVTDTLLFAFVLITVIFHYLGEPLSRNAALWRWDPRKLPAIDAAATRISLPRTYFILISLVLFLAVLTAGNYGIETADFTLTLDEVAARYMLPLRILVVLSMAVYVGNLFQRYWTRLKLFAIGGACLIAAVLLVRIALLPQILHIIVHLPNTPAEEAAANEWVSWWPDLNVRVFCGVLAASLLYRCWQLFRRSKTGQVPPV